MLRFEDGTIGLALNLDEDTIGAVVLGELDGRKTQRAEALHRQLLAFGRKQILRFQVLDLNRVILDAHSMLRRLIREDVAIDLDLNLGPNVTRQAAVHEHESVRAGIQHVDVPSNRVCG